MVLMNKKKKKKKQEKVKVKMMKKKKKKSNWVAFKIGLLLTCEICGATAKNVAGEQSNQESNASAHSQTTAGQTQTEIRGTRDVAYGTLITHGSLVLSLISISLDFFVSSVAPTLDWEADESFRSSSDMRRNQSASDFRASGGRGAPAKSKSSEDILFEVAA
ncbi:hypothetical protein F2Q70_00023486 [Brassica cretica]|uniref:Uncharacterized protein n=1 Tax=Brassica cretica TaxID=69181 RepID=A0A8S9GRA1_BRACR|nr:hypothetical protein F2Q70_00023486 [Brassica cretica]